MTADTAGPPLLLATLRRQAERRPDHVAVRFLERGETETGSLTYAALERDMTALAGGLLAQGLQGRPLVLALPQGLRLITTVLACLRAGVLAVPVPFPPTGEGRERLRQVLADLRAPTVLVERRAAAALPDGVGRIVEWDEVAAEQPGALPPEPGPDAPGVIQYSSGSTTRPRGIVVSHGNIAVNAAIIGVAFGITPDDIGVTWLPPHHDMGLFGTMVQPLFHGATCILMPTFAFMQRPLRWLRAMAAFGGTVAGGPNLGYELCSRRIEPRDVAGLDLSRWRVAFCGAEPVRAPSLRRFTDLTNPARFRPDALLPCYGLAEATLMVTCAPTGRGVLEAEVADREGGPVRARVLCGHPPPGSSVSIASPETGELLPPGSPGEVYVEGGHVAIGAWDAAAGTVTELANVVWRHDGRRVLRTGDVGVMTPDGLVVVDRLKDVVCVHGRNVHAVDAEAAALSVADDVVTALAAFGVEEDDREALVLLCEGPWRKERLADEEAVCRRIAGAVAAQCGLMPRVELRPRGALPRTTSGKIRRQAAREAYLHERRMAAMPETA